MAKIFYSMAGEGRGHASRANTVIENLRDRYEIHVYAPDHAYDLLHPLYRKTDVKINRIPGLLFHYNSRKEIDYLKTFSESVKFIFNSPGNLRHIYSDFEKHSPDMVITDFESMLPRAAEKFNVPYISINHQHFLAYYCLEGLSAELRRKAAVVSPFLNLFHMNQAATIISAFYFPQLKLRKDRNIHQVGVFLNSAIMNAEPSDRGFVLVYLRRFLTDGIMKALENCGEKVKIYCSENHRDYKNISFKKISCTGFCEDLADCSALVTTAGNQLVGEALYLGKKILTIPEPNNFEQEINGFFLEKSNGGKCIQHDRFGFSTVREFLRDRDHMSCSIPRNQLNGNNDADTLIDHYINAALDSKTRTRIQQEKRLIS